MTGRPAKFKVGDTQWPVIAFLKSPLWEVGQTMVMACVCLSVCAYSLLIRGCYLLYTHVDPIVNYVREIFVNPV